MDVIPIKILLTEKEQQFIQLQEAIEAKRRMLLDKQKKIRFISKNNDFLHDIRNDYATYYKYISQQKHDQIRALQLLHEYMNDLAITEKISKHNIEDAKVEQSKIMREINAIKKGLNSIIENTDTIINEL